MNFCIILTFFLVSPAHTHTI